MGLILWGSPSSWFEDCRQSLKKAAAPSLSFKRIVRSATTTYNCTGTLSFLYHPFSQLNEKWVASYHLVCTLVYSTWTWTRDVHSTPRNISTSLMSLLLSLSLLNVLGSHLTLRCHHRSYCHSCKKKRLTLCEFIVSHATLIFYYQAFMLRLQISSISHALWLSRVWHSRV